MHGGLSPGAPEGPANGNFRHGRYTKAAIAMRLQVAELIAGSRDFLRRIED